MEVGWYRQAKQRGQRPKTMGHKHGNSLNHKVGNLEWDCNLLFKIKNHKGWNLNSYPRLRG